MSESEHSGARQDSGGGSSLDGTLESAGAPGSAARPGAGPGRAAAPAALALALIFGPSLRAHYRRSLDPARFNNDVRAQIYPFFRFETPERFVDDHVGDYFVRARFPVGYTALYALAGTFRAVSAASRLLPYALLAATIACMAFAAGRIGGWAAAALAAAIALSSGVYLDCLAGALSRAFGLPVAAGALLALVTGSPWWLAVLTVAGAALYPVAGMLAGGCLALLLLLPESFTGLRRDRWPARRRLAVLAGAAVLSGAALLPQALGARPYGRLITLDRIAEFPEAGPGGRYGGTDRPPFKSLLHVGWSTADDAVLGAGEPFLPRIHAWLSAGERRRQAALLLFLALAGAGWLRVARDLPAARRFLILPAVAAAGFYAALLLYPLLYLPHRFVLYGLTPAVTVVLAAGPAGLLSRASRALPWRRAAAVAAAGVPLLAVFGARGSPDQGIDIRADPSAPLFRAMADLPANALLAGWPTGPADDATYVSRIRPFVTFETHQAQHDKETLEMRRRAMALVDAYFATGPEPLARLRSEFDVTHLLVDADQLASRSAAYFKPFDEAIARARARAEGRELELTRLRPRAAFDDGRYYILELARAVP